MTIKKYKEILKEMSGAERQQVLSLNELLLDILLEKINSKCVPSHSFALSQSIQDSIKHVMKKIEE